MEWPHEDLETAIELDQEFRAFRPWEDRRRLRHPDNAERVVELLVKSRQRDPAITQELQSLRQRLVSCERRLAVHEEAWKRLASLMIGEGKLEALRAAFSGMDTSEMPSLRVLEPPRAAPGQEAPPGSEETFRAMSAALKAARTTHPGQWVALRDGAIVDADNDRVVLHRRLEAKGLLGQLFFARIPPW